MSATAVAGRPARRPGLLARHRDWAILLAPSAIVVLGLFVVPLAIMVRYSFDRFIPGGLQESAFIPDNYQRFFESGLYRDVLVRTLWIGLLVTATTLVLSFPLAYALARSGRTWSRILTIIVVVPLLTSVVVRSYGWMILLGEGGVVEKTTTAVGLPKTQWMFTSRGVVISLVEVLMPFMVLTLAGVIQQIDPKLESAVRSLGGGSWQVFRDVVLPLSLPGIAAGCLLVFVLSISAFATPALVGGQQTQVVASVIFQQATNALNWPFASATSMIVLVLVLALVLAQGRLLRRSPARGVGV